MHDCCYDVYGDYFATASSDQRIRVFKRRANREFTLDHELAAAHAGSILRLSWAHPQFGCLLASCSVDRVVHIYQRSNTGSWKKRGRLVDARGSVTCVAFSPPHLGLMIASCSTDGKVRVYECTDWQSLNAWQMVHEFDAGSSDCAAISWNPSPFDAASIAVAVQNTVKVFELSLMQGKWVQCAELQGHTDVVHDVSWAHSCGRSSMRIATACKDSNVRVFELSCKQINADSSPTWIAPPPTTLSFHRSPVWRVAWNLTGSLLASSADDGTTRIFKADFNGQWKQLLQANNSSNPIQSAV